MLVANPEFIAKSFEKVQRAKLIAGDHLRAHDQDCQEDEVPTPIECSCKENV